MIIRYMAPQRGGWAHPAGSFARGSRDYCHALHGAGFNVQLDSECLQDSADYRAAQNLSAEVRAAEKYAPRMSFPRHSDKPMPHVLINSVFGIETKHYDAGRLERFKKLGVLMKVKAFILQTTFESTTFSDEVIQSLRLWDAVFVPSKWNADCLREAGVEHVYAIPHAISEWWDGLTTIKQRGAVHIGIENSFTIMRLPTPSPVPTLPFLRLDLSGMRKIPVFGWIGTWEPRKAGELAIHAFIKAFKPGEARLLIKCNPTMLWKGYATPFEACTTLAAREAAWRDVDWREHIKIIDQVMLREELNAFIASLDVFVSSSHGEGFCLPGLEAKLAGCRVVATDSGGVREFMTDDDILVPGGLAPSMWNAAYGWPIKSSWFHHDVNDLAAALRSATTMPPPAPFDSIKFRSVGQDLRAMIEETITRKESELASTYSH